MEPFIGNVLVNNKIPILYFILEDRFSYLGIAL